MVSVVGQWSGCEAWALRVAMRLSVRDFAARLGMNDKPVSSWESRGRRALPRHETQQLLDLLLKDADDDVKARFELLLRQGTGDMGSKSAERTKALLAAIQPHEPLLSNLGDIAGVIEWPVWFGVRLAQLIGTVDNWLGADVQFDALQVLLDREILMFDVISENRGPAHALSRRQTLVTIAALPLTLATPVTGALGAGAATEFFLARCAASLTACWHLLKGSDLYTVDQVLSSYLLKLEAIAWRQSAHREVAARLASQAHRICGIVALHRNGLKRREWHCKQAVHCASATSDVGSRAAALISLASTHFYEGDPARAAAIFEQALTFESALPLLQRSRIHAELSVVYGQLGRERDALSSAELAERWYPTQPEQDPSYLYAEFTRASLTLEQGLSYLALAERFPGGKYQRRATDAFACVEKAMLAPVPDRIRFEIINHQAKAAILLDDLDSFESYVGRAVDGVVLLSSKQRQKEIQTAWRCAIEKWPNEQRLKALGDRLRHALNEPRQGATTESS